LLDETRRLGLGRARGAPEQVVGEVEVLEAGPGPGRAPAVRLRRLRRRAHRQRPADAVACPAHTALSALRPRRLGRAIEQGRGRRRAAGGALDRSMASRRGIAPLPPHLRRAPGPRSALARRAPARHAAASAPGARAAARAARRQARSRPVEPSQAAMRPRAGRGARDRQCAGEVVAGQQQRGERLHGQRRAPAWRQLPCAPRARPPHTPGPRLLRRRGTASPRAPRPQARVHAIAQRTRPLL